MLKWGYTYLIVFLLLTGPAYAHAQDLKFMNLSSKEGLSSNNITSTLKDRFGYMWFGTDDGLNKFDGKQFTIYRHDESDSTSIASNEILSLYEDDQGNLWIGTGSGVVLYNRKKDAFVNYDKALSLPMVSIVQGPNDKLWLATYHGLFNLDPKTGKVSLFSAKNERDRAVVSKTVSGLFRDKHRQIWLGTTTGLYRYQEAQHTFKRFAHDARDAQDAAGGNSLAGNSLVGNSIRAIAEDQKGNLWVGTNTGLSMFVPGMNRFVNYRHDPRNNRSLSSDLIYALAVEPNGDIWVGTEGGLNILNPSSRAIVRVERDPRNHYSLVGKAVKCINIDRDNIYWVSTVRGGLNKYDKNVAFFNLRQSSPFDPFSLSAPVVTSFAQAGDKGVGEGVFVGTDGGGLNLFNPRTGLVKRLPVSAAGNGKSILAMERVGTDLWIGTFLDGLFIYDTRTGRSRQVTAGRGADQISGKDVFCIKRDRKGNVWIGTNGQGVSWYDVSAKRFRQFSVKDKGATIIPSAGYIRAIEEDQEGNILMGSNGAGIAIYNPRTGQTKVLDHASSKLPKDNVNTIFVGADGTMWVGMTEGGLARYDGGKKQFNVYSEKDGLANGAIYKILEDKTGMIWMSTNKGLSSFDPRLKRFKNYGYHNGLQRSPFVLGAGMKMPDGTLFFGGADGFNYADPAALRFNVRTPRVVLSDFKIANKSVTPGAGSAAEEHISMVKTIEVDYKQNFSLSFTALNFTSPQDNRYMYKLDKFDKEWNYVGAVNTAVYTNLDPGTYTFHVKAISESGDWSSTVTSIEISVRPPFWKTYYAYALYVLAAASLLWYIRLRGIQKLKAKFALEQERSQVRQMIEQERREAERLHEFDQLKIKFLTNLSHEFRTPISLIVGPVDQLVQQESNPVKAERLNMVRRNARRLLNLVNQLLDLRTLEEKELKLNLTEGDFITFARDVAESFRDLSAKKQINFEFRSELKEYFTRFDHEKLFNLLSNAFKFTLKGDDVILKIEKGNQLSGLKVSLMDTGVGIAEDAREKIFDRFFQAGQGAAVLNPGSGIGLSITREFVKMHGGTIEVESIAGSGSTFTIYFPFDNIDDSGPQMDLAVQPFEAAAAEISGATPGAAGQLPVILLVEDNEDFRFYLKDNLKTFYKIEEASNGKEGWQKVLSTHPKLVVSDVSMPYVSGIELCKKIKLDKRTSHIPVLLLTALTSTENQLTGLKTGANDYMTKPFNFEILNIKIRNLLTLNARFKDTYSKQIKVLQPELKFESDQEKLLSKVIQYIETNLTNPQLSVEDLSRHIGMSRGTLYTRILQLTGETPVEFIRSVKLDKAAVLLEKSDMNIAQVSYAVGFSSPNYFARTFKTRFNMLPSDYVQLKRVQRKVPFESTSLDD
jgi:signal transduction histidine kinase/ligand-binding sensor domain-containing protein/DNA-binding response OmpR family regulator